METFGSTEKKVYVSYVLYFYSDFCLAFAFARVLMLITFVVTAASDSDKRLLGFLKNVCLSTTFVDTPID